MPNFEGIERGVTRILHSFKTICIIFASCGNNLFPLNYGKKKSRLSGSLMLIVEVEVT
jgi:hypothetical protein